MNRFKVGDKVVRIDGGPSPLPIGTTSTVSKIINDNYMELRGFEGGWKSSCFELHKPNRHLHADLMILFANDSTLVTEFRSGHTSSWHSCNGVPAFKQDTEYRIKPEYQLVTPEMLSAADDVGYSHISDKAMATIFTAMYNQKVKGDG